MVMTTQNAGGLIPSGGISEVSMATPTVKMRIVNRARYLAGILKPIGSIIELSPTVAKEWAYNRWAEYVKEEPPKAAPAAPAALKKEETAKSEKSSRS